MTTTLVLLLLGGLVTVVAGQRSAAAAKAVAALSLAAALTVNVLLLLNVYLAGPVSHRFPWLGPEEAPIATLGFLGDGLSVPVAVLVLALGLFSVIYSFVYMRGLNNHGLYYGLMVWFVAAMVGVLYATDLLQFFVFYEAMLVPAFALVYLYGVSEDPEVRARNALQFWVWTALGGLISLFAVFMLYGALGTLDIATLQSMRGLLQVDLARLIGLVFLLGFGIKLGLVPLHVWAPRAYGEAPIPVLVLLSGAMTKTAAYGVIRIVIPLFADVMRSLSTGLMAVSLITMFYGAALAIAQRDLKMMLAYSSISQLGYLMFGYSTMTLIGVSGAVFQLVNHGMLASLMFFCAGAVEMRTGTMEFSGLGGLGPKMPGLATAFVIGGLALSGTPPMSAFAGEWMIFAGAAERAVLAGVGQPYYLALTVLGVVATGLTAAYYLWAIRRVFYGPVPEGLESVTDAPVTVLAIVSLIVLPVVVLGIWPRLLWVVVERVLSTFPLGG